MSLLRTLTLSALTLAVAGCSDHKIGSKVNANRQALSTNVAVTASTTNPAVGGALQLTLTAPVHADVSTISQTMQLSFDPAKITATGVPTIPQGWTATYFSGGTALAAVPTTSAGWATVDSIVATGSVESDGTAVGQQVIIGHADGTVAVPPTASTFSGGSAGDGWSLGVAGGQVHARAGAEAQVVGGRPVEANVCADAQVAHAGTLRAGVADQAQLAGAAVGVEHHRQREADAEALAQADAAAHFAYGEVADDGEDLLRAGGRHLVDDQRLVGVVDDQAQGRGVIAPVE